MKIFGRDLKDFSEDYVDRFKKLLIELGIETAYSQKFDIDAALEKAGINDSGGMRDMPVKDIKEYPKIILEPKITALYAKHEEREFFLDINLEHHDTKVKNKILLTCDDYKDLLMVGELAEKHRLKLEHEKAELYEKLKNDQRCVNCDRERCYNKITGKDRCDYYGTYDKEGTELEKQLTDDSIEISIETNHDPFS